MSLKPHHVLGVESPTLFLESLGCQVLGLGSLHVVEDEEECLSAQPLEEVNGVTAGRWGLGVVLRGVTWVPRQVWSQPLRVTRVWQVVGGSLQHTNIIQELINIRIIS